MFNSQAYAAAHSIRLFRLCLGIFKGAYSDCACSGWFAQYQPLAHMFNSADRCAMAILMSLSVSRTARRAMLWNILFGRNSTVCGLEWGDTGRSDRPLLWKLSNKYTDKMTPCYTSHLFGHEKRTRWWYGIDARLKALGQDVQ